MHSDFRGLVFFLWGVGRSRLKPQEMRYFESIRNLDSYGGRLEEELVLFYPTLPRNSVKKLRRQTIMVEKDDPMHSIL